MSVLENRTQRGRTGEPNRDGYSRTTRSVAAARCGAVELLRITHHNISYLFELLFIGGCAEVTPQTHTLSQMAHTTPDMNGDTPHQTNY